MKQISLYIFEGLRINKDTKIKYKDENDIIYDIIIAAYLSIYRLKCWTETSTFKKKVLYIKYEDILDILNNNFGYSFSKEDIKKTSGYIWKIVKEYLIPIQNMINGYQAIIKIGEEKITIDYKEIDKKYKDILNKNK